MREITGEQYVFPQTHKTVDALAALGERDSMEGEVAIGGRLLGFRDQGKIVFGDLRDELGEIQVIAEDGSTPEFDKFQSLNVGDWLGAIGEIARSNRGQPSLFVKDWACLAKTEISFPDKREGLKDPDTIARQRYLDLAVNPESTERFIQRSKIVSFIRRELDMEGFIEVETPMLQTLYGGAAARPFETHHNALDIDMYLRIAPELFLKRLVVGGLQRVYEIGKVFRNEGISTRHNPEFTMMEVYGAFWDYQDQMTLTENLVAGASKLLHGTTEIEYQGQGVDLTPPWKRETMDNLVSKAVEHPVSVESGVDRLRKICDEHDVPYDESYGAGKLLLELYEKTVESSLWGPIFVTEYPKEVSPLARTHRNRPDYTERFEGIVAGRELCNGYTELNDPKEQYRMFLQEVAAGEQGDEEAMLMDHDYIRALKYGLPPTAGMGIGIDRLTMLLTNSASIREVVLFPTMKPDGYTTSYEN